MSNWHAKWRAKSFKTFIGHESEIAIVKKDLASEDMTQTWLVTGEPGSGKTTLAYLIARKILGCGIKDDVRQHPDFTELNANKEGSKENIINLIQNTRFRPKKADYKVIFVDEVHTLLKPAASAMLDILEEPPKHVIILLATNEPEKVLPTIRQRAKHIHLQTLTRTELQTLLTRIANREEMTFVTETMIAYIAKRFVGRTREAITVLKDLKTVGEKGKVDAKELEAQLERDVSDDYAVAAKILGALYTGDYSTACQTVADIQDVNHAVNSLLDLNNYIIQRLSESRFYVNDTRKQLWKQIGGTRPHIRVSLLVQGFLFELKRSLTVNPMLDVQQVLLYYVASSAVGLMKKDEG